MVNLGALNCCCTGTIGILAKYYGQKMTYWHP